MEFPRFVSRFWIVLPVGDVRRSKLKSKKEYIDPQILRRNKQRKSPLKSTDFRGLWSEWGDSNARLLEPKSSALPTGPHPDISLFTSPARSGDFSCLWAFLWSTADFQPNPHRAKTTRSPVCQGVPGFRFGSHGCRCLPSQSRRATSCATPGYFSTHAVF